MARWTEPTVEQEQGYLEWVASRPDVVRVIAERFDPWTLYRMKSTGSRVTLASFNEDGTVRVDVSADFNFTLFERSVFGVDPDDLEPCELPSPHELTGAVLTASQVDANIDVLRVAVRPDLWVMGDDGKASRRH